MKKIIHGILILIGIASIASNFMVDTSKLDHKKVSASGTACKWISDNGYGVGPVYYDENADVQNYITVLVRQSSKNVLNDYYVAYAKFVNGLKLLDCNQSNVGKTFDANKVYADNKGTSFSATKTISGNICKSSDSVEISPDGTVTVNYPEEINWEYQISYGTYQIDSSTCDSNNIKSVVLDTNLFASSVSFPIEIPLNFDSGDKLQSYSANGGGLNVINGNTWFYLPDDHYTASFNNKTIIAQPTQYTCVCAEY